MNTPQNDLYRMGKFVIAAVKNMITFAEEHDLLNTQTFINILDELNELSVKY